MFEGPCALKALAMPERSWHRGGWMEACFKGGKRADRWAEVHLENGLRKLRTLKSCFLIGMLP